MSLFTFHDYDQEITDMIVNEGAMGVRPSEVKRSLALMWLERPTGFIARVRWAWRLVRS
jgi:hypothetical protein